MNGGFARPHLSRHGLSDRSAVRDNVVESSFSAVILSDCICADEPRSMVGLKFVMTLPEKIGNKISAARNARKGVAQSFYVLGAVFQIGLARVEVRWIADDCVYLRPLSEERVGADD